LESSKSSTTSDSSYELLDRHPRTAIAVSKLAEEELALGHRETAISTARAGFDSVSKFLSLRSVSIQHDRAGTEALRPAALSLLETLYVDLGAEQGSGNELEAFEVIQRLQSSSADVALRQFITRLIDQDPSRRDLLRRVQDLGDELSRIDTSLMESVSTNAQLNLERIERIKERQLRTEAALQVLKSRIGSNGKLDQLAQDNIVPYSQIKSLLEPTEALLTFETGVDTTFVFVATRDRLKWFRADLSQHDLRRKIATLRCGVDIERWIGEDRSFCYEVTNPDPKNWALPFDTAVAHELYQYLLAPAEDLISGKALIFSLSGPMSNLPPHLLVTQPIERSIAMTDKDFSKVDRLIKKHAISILPSIASLAVLRSKPETQLSTVKSSATRETYIGLGNPTLVGNSSCPHVEVPRQCSQLVRVAANQSSNAASRGAVDLKKSYFHGTLADVQAVRQICPLPETETELRCVAKDLGGNRETLVLGVQLTETAIKHLPLERYRIIHFATHGLLADQTRSFGGPAAEPALVLAPPKVATVEDDGLLTASEIAQLKLNADWVILSACNTAAAGSLETDALSGLARAFFYAGARRLLVSHWSVDSAATVVLIGRAFSAMAQNRDVEPAEGLRESILSMIAEPAFSHPAKWAPFVLIGDSKRFL
jgi:CHAT domain-containing protein